MQGNLSLGSQNTDHIHFKNNWTAVMICFNGYFQRHDKVVRSNLRSSRCPKNSQAADVHKYMNRLSVYYKTTVIISLNFWSTVFSQWKSSEHGSFQHAIILLLLHIL